MKTIEIQSGNQKAQFTTKSVTFDGKEFFYSHMSDVAHNVEEHYYTFTYDGEYKTLPYEAKDGKILAAIFRQVKSIEAQRQAASKKSATAQAPAKPKAPETPPADQAADETAEKKPEKKEAAPEKPEAPEKVKEETTQEDAKGALSQEKKEAPPEEKTAAPSEEKADIVPEAKSEEGEKAPADPEKQTKLKKSLITFGIVVAVILVLSIIYFFVFGTSSDPSTVAPNSTESQQYEDIDQLIDDLQ